MAAIENGDFSMHIPVVRGVTHNEMIGRCAELVVIDV
jgi:hypothetical protein